MIFGLTFKKNCPDARNSKVADIIGRLQEYGIEPEVVDPWADPNVARHEYGVELKVLDEIKNADCIIVAVAHKEFKEIGLEGLKKLYSNNSEKVLIDVKGIFHIKDLQESGLIWWRL